MKKLIVHLDDLGSCQEFTEALTILRDKVTSCSVQMCAPFAQEAIPVIKSLGIDVGVHITLNSEMDDPAHRFASLTNAKSLHDSDGFMWKTRQETLAHAKDAEVFAEIDAQIDAALDAGLPITHVDTHMGTHMLKTSWLCHVIDKCERHGRRPLLMRLGRCFRKISDHIGIDMLVIGGLMLDAEREGHALLDSLKIDGFGENRSKDMLQYIENLPPGVHQLLVHPCKPSHSLAKKLGPRRAAKRVEDFALLMSGAVQTIAEARGISLISWRDIPVKSRNS